MLATMRISLWPLLAAGLAATIGVSCAPATKAEPKAQASPSDDAPSALVVRVYDGRGLSLGDEPRVAALYENLARQSIDPKSWKDRHGAGEVSYSLGKFVVLQTPANHLRIQDLFGRLRDAGPSEDGVVTLTFDIGDFIDRATANIEAAKTEVREGDTRTPPVQPMPTVDEMIEQISGLIKDTVSRESWVENGGNVGTIRRSDRQLVVRQTIEAQRKLAKLFEQLREHIDDPPQKVGSSTSG